MIELADSRGQLQRAWDDGTLLREWLSGSERWPWSMPARAPSGSDLLRRYEAVREWISRLERDVAAGGNARIEYAEVRVQKLGTQSLPSRVWIDRRDQALVLIDRAEAFAHFQALVEQTRSQMPELLSWIARRPLRALDNHGDWQQVLGLVAWFMANPASGLHVRQVDIGGTDTKFVESRLPLLAELVEEISPSTGKSDLGNSSRRLAERLGLRVEDLSVRVRLLDSRLVQHYRGISDLTVPVREFATLNPPCDVVFITENKTNGLCFPQVPCSIVVFGLGYGVEALRDAEWLKQKRVVYWGDIDTHGYHILSRCRGYWPHLESMLMDESSLARWAGVAVSEPEGSRNPVFPPNLTEAERAAFDSLVGDRWGFRIRLEQERIPFNAVREAVGASADRSTFARC